MRIPDALAAEWRAACAEYEDAMQEAPRQQAPYRALTSRQLEAARRRVEVAMRCMFGAKDDE